MMVIYIDIYDFFFFFATMTLNHYKILAIHTCYNVSTPTMYIKNEISDALRTWFELWLTRVYYPHHFVKCKIRECIDILSLHKI